MGPQAASVLETVIQSSNVHSASKASIWGILVLGVSASVIFAQLQSTLNVIFQSEDQSKSIPMKQYLLEFISRRLVCFGMVIAFIFLSIVSLFLSSVFNLIFTGELAVFIKGVQFIGSLFVYSILFAVILKWMPDRKVPWKTAIRGGLMTGSMFMFGQILIGLYIGGAALGSAYGAAGSLIVLLVWVYYSSFIVLLGAEISAVALKGSNSQVANMA
jgi:membrane protein